MLYDFTYYNPTKIYFGKKSMDNLSKELQNYGKNILLLYGKNSIKKIGLYDEVLNILKDENIIEKANENAKYFNKMIKDKFENFTRVSGIKTRFRKILEILKKVLEKC